MNNRNYQTISIQKYPAFGLCVFPNILRALDSCRREPGLIRNCKGNATSCKLQIVSFCTPPSHPDYLTDALYWGPCCCLITPLPTLEVTKRQAVRCTQNQTLPREFFRNLRRPLWLQLLVLYPQGVFAVISSRWYSPSRRSGGLPIVYSRTDKTQLVHTCGTHLNRRNPGKH